MEVCRQVTAHHFDFSVMVDVFAIVENNLEREAFCCEDVARCHLILTMPTSQSFPLDLGHLCYLRMGQGLGGAPRIYSQLDSKPAVSGCMPLRAVFVHSVDDVQGGAASVDFRILAHKLFPAPCLKSSDSISNEAHLLHG